MSSGKAVCEYGVFQRLAKAHPDKTQQEIRADYRAYLKSLSLIDTTTENDIAGWIIRRMTGKQTLDAIIIVYGDRGVGKSYVCGAIGESVDKRLCSIRKEPIGSYFSVNNVRSVDPQGTLQLLSPEQLKQKPNQVFVIDDASITSNARSFQSQQNQYINYVLTTARIYRHCIIINTIASNLIDSVVRSFADIGIMVMGVMPYTTLNRCKIYRMSHSNHMGFKGGKREGVGKFFQLTVSGERTRLTTWYVNKPSDAWIRDYDILRKENTDRLGDVMLERFKSVSLDGKSKKEEREKKRKEDEEKREQKRLEEKLKPPEPTRAEINKARKIEENYQKVVDFYTGVTTGKKESIRATSRGTQLPVYRVEQIIGEYISKVGHTGYNDKGVYFEGNGKGGCKDTSDVHKGGES
jgi:hypothetical protein